MIETRGFDYGIARSKSKANAMHYSAKIAQMRKAKADRRIAIVMVVMFIIALVVVNKINCYYTAKAKVVASQNGVTTFEFANGERYDAFTEGEFIVNSTVLVTFNDCGTETATDDEIINVQKGE